MNDPNLPDELVEFLKSDRVLKYDPSACEIGSFTFYLLEDIKPIEIQLSTIGQDWKKDDPHHGRGYYVGEGFDLIKECEHYDPRGILVYVPVLTAFGSYDNEHSTLVIYPDVIWSQFAADPVRYINAAWGLGPDSDCAKFVNPIGIFRHVGPTAPPDILQFGNDYIQVTCEACGQDTRSAKALYNQPGFYWVCYNCECGHTKCITDVRRDRIPESLRAAADLRHHAAGIKVEVDQQRRSLPQSTGKTLLRKALLDMPVRQSDGNWLVYESPREWKVIYSEGTQDYWLTRIAGHQKVFANVADLSSFLERLQG